ncbi:MAG: GntR family transcriptional regulator [candidate division NC10 bacterium]
MDGHTAIKLFLPERKLFFTKTDYVLESIRTAILLGYIPPGTSITEKQIRDILHVSSSPIREALNQLEAEGLLTRFPHAGTKVAEIVIEDAKEIYAIQALLQSGAVQICANKIQPEDICEAEKLNAQINDIVLSGNVDLNTVKILNYRFHLIVCGGSVYPWLTRIISALWIRLPKKTVWLIPAEAKAAIRYHNGILRAIKKRDSSLAGDLMKKHLQRSRSVLYG